LNLRKAGLIGASPECLWFAKSAFHLPATILPHTASSFTGLTTVRKIFTRPQNMINWVLTLWFCIFAILIILASLAFMSQDALPPFKITTQVFLNQISVEADRYYEKHQMFAKTHVSSCNAADSLFAEDRLSVLLKQIEFANKDKAICYATRDAWAVSIKLKDTPETWCIDASGSRAPGLAHEDGQCQ
jgi:hypothetical protein